MERYSSSSQKMRHRSFLKYFVSVCLLFLIYQSIKTNSALEKLEKLNEIVSEKQIQLALLATSIPPTKSNDPIVVYAITPTYARPVQKAELTRISQTLALVPNIHWIVVEDSEEKTTIVKNLLNDLTYQYTHLVAKTPSIEKLKAQDPRWKKHRGVEQRNVALRWLRTNLVLNKDKGVVFFMDDDNTYSVKLFKEIEKVKRVGVWPVGLVGGYSVEAPELDPKTGKVVGFLSGWRSDRRFAIDMAGFGINLDLILSKPDVEFSYSAQKGFQESEFLVKFTTKEELEPLADNCTKVYVWHTRTEKPQIKKFVDGFEV
ncbi:galactosylgalactosylxylosylprotein 3-beta-glucuronosyltransferase I [Agrilus planipennis]|uniref:Galactosylgalactosylxylosylprotein 3-beta-glucuronosyltransferase n=1 Tax=Agrilus planipennis TaxID=224129 RepID=A0A1W4WEK0_AGRPL|nr:galactosylgalactosylxylosylprotein 3-beta-glucuronosyltransferase I [Agrilus planipennis]XP_018322385.1 galactosylgalactosylxylosylprotein 3-beta-glucuronosyltransferase I [Agrilus planipennis]XP_018322386.1 galactosylgalactosylxylosylprotein 3-beta-glucuronosyltransferase I [Agrilus planipennis]